MKDAGLQLREAMQRVQQLEDVIAVFTQKMENGEPWPATQSEGENSDAATQC